MEQCVEESKQVKTKKPSLNIPSPSYRREHFYLGPDSRLAVPLTPCPPLGLYYSMERFHIVIIGAGAAGLMCALTAGQRGRKVLLMDHASRVGKKILISGGGRCNFTNLQVEPFHFLSNNPHFCKSALSRYTPEDFIGLVKKHGVHFYEKKLGQLFCNGKSNEIVTLLLEECRLGNVRIRTNCFIEKVKKEKRFTLSTNLGTYDADSLVIATGGLSVPKMGASGFGYAVAKQFGLRVLPCPPGLVSLNLSSSLLKDLAGFSGISVDALVSCNGKSFREAILFTHKGLSGPAILQISNYWKPGNEIVVNLLPDLNLTEAIRDWQKVRPTAELKTLLGHLLPHRLAQRWLELRHQNKPVNQYNKKEINEISESFQQWPIVPIGNGGYRTAEVTLGGVDTDELSSKTFEAKSVEGLYFIGEVVDVTGWLGGYNFQWAWASGHCAGQYA